MIQQVGNEKQTHCCSSSQVRPGYWKHRGSDWFDPSLLIRSEGLLSMRTERSWMRRLWNHLSACHVARMWGSFENKPNVILHLSFVSKTCHLNLLKQLLWFFCIYSICNLLIFSLSVYFCISSNLWSSCNNEAWNFGLFWEEINGGSSTSSTRLCLALLSFFLFH